MMEIQTTEEIWRNFCKQLDLEILEVGAKTRVSGWCRVYQEENKDKKWIAVDDVLKWVLEMELGGSISIAETKELKAQKRGEMLMLNKFRLEFGKTKR